MSNKSNKKNISNIASIFGYDKKTKQKLPLFVSKVPAGFPSPAGDFIEKKLDLNDYLIRKPASTFFVQVDGDSMINAGIHSGDILIVDRSLDASNGKIIVAIFNGEFTVKRLNKRGEEIHLIAENPNYEPIRVTEGEDFEVWGVVTYVIHDLK
jgi:DNA polymerase V